MGEYGLEEVMEAYRRKWEDGRDRMQNYRPPDYKCKYCRDTGFVSLYPQNTHRAAMGKTDVVIYCPHCRASMLKDISGIIAEYRDLDIARFPWGTYRDAACAGKVRKTVESFVYDFQKWRDEGIGLYLYSTAKGSGKTMAASAICGSICAKYNISVRLTKVEDFLDDLKKTYGSRGTDELSRANFRKYYDAELLALDDLCVTELSSWGKDRLHDLVNERYKAGKLCIVTSNHAPWQLKIHEATVDRLNDMCAVLHFPEEAVRAVRAKERKDRLAQLVQSYDKFTDAGGKTPFEGGGRQ